MTQEQMIELARRAVACKGWRWIPGMRWWTEDDRGRLDDFQPEYMGRPHDALPDLTDPATLGCLLHLVREAWGDPTIVTAATLELGGVRGWVAECWAPQSPLHTLTPRPTEAAALVAALEAAP
jgi:hypothetical protein